MSTRSSQNMRSSHFPDTRWSLIDAIGRGEAEAFDALSQVCEIYWYPIYAFFRDQRKSHHDAQDLTQGFFEGVLRRQDFSKLDQSKGNFRAFLSASARNFAIKEYYRMKTDKRGGGKVFSGFDEELAEKLYSKDRLHKGGGSPEMIYDKRWGMALLGTVMERLRAEAESKGKADEFAALEGYLDPNGREAPVKKVAKKLKKTEGAVRTEVFRYRQRYGKLLRLEIARLVNGPEEVEEEISYLVELMGKDSGAESDSWLLNE